MIKSFILYPINLSFKQTNTFRSFFLGVVKITDFCCYTFGLFGIKFKKKNIPDIFRIRREFFCIFVLNNFIIFKEDRRRFCRIPIIKNNCLRKIILFFSCNNWIFSCFLHLLYFPRNKNSSNLYYRK